MALSGFIELDARIKAVDMDTLKELAVEENSVTIAKLNADQMLEGLTAEAKPIRPKYTPTYLKRKRRMGYSLDGTPDLKYTGAFQGDMDTLVNRGEYNVTSYDEKANMLRNRYGAEIFGLSADNIEKAQISVTNSFISLYSRNILAK